jgi:hypothetical protein
MMHPILSSRIPAKRLLAAVWFAAIALLCVAVMFHKLTMSFRGILLYMVLPMIASGIAGSLWGVSILNRAKTNTVGHSVLRGIGVSGGAFVIFTLMFALALPLTERGWSVRNSEAIFLFTWTLGLLLAGPIVLFGGMLAGATLYLLGYRVFGE